MLRTALIGGGVTVRIGHAPALQKLRESFEVVALAERDPEVLELSGVLLGVSPEHRYADYREMLARESIDLVDIAVPHAFHHEAARAALMAGAHLVTERPLALNLHDAEEILRLAEFRGKQVTVLHFYLYYPPFREAIRLAMEGAIGETFFVRCEGVTGGYGAGTATYHPEWHGNPEVAGGGVWIDSGYHGAYLCVHLQRSPAISAAAQIGTFATDLPVEDTALVLLTHENGGMSSIQVAWSVPAGGQRVFEIYGTRGAIALDHEGYPLGLYRNATATWEHPAVEMHANDSFTGFFQALADCLLRGAPPPVSHREALHTLEIILAGYRASENASVESIIPGGT
ncbi:MAG: Gfo/Idh/MocA family protein [Armatimonadota bacterium]